MFKKFYIRFRHSKEREQNMQTQIESSWFFAYDRVSALAKSGISEYYRATFNIVYLSYIKLNICISQLNDQSK